MQSSADTRRPPDDHPRANKVENLLQSQARPAQEPGSIVASPPIDRTHSSNSLYIADQQHHQPDSRRQSDDQQGSRRQSGEQPLSPAYSRPSGPSSRQESQQQQQQQPSVPASPFAQRQPFMHADAAPPASESAAVPASQPGRPAMPIHAALPPPPFSPPQHPPRRTRQHAATISEPLASLPRSHPSPQTLSPQQQQQQHQPGNMFQQIQPQKQQNHQKQQQQQPQQPAGFRFYQPPPPHYSQQQHPQSQQQHHHQQQPRSAASGSFDSHQLQTGASPLDMRPRRLSFIGTPLATDPYRDQYETSFSRSTSTTGPHYSASAQPSPHGPYFPNSAGAPFTPRPPPYHHHQQSQPQQPQQQQPQQHVHGMQPPASAPSHQQTFGRPPLGGPAGPYGPRTAHGGILAPGMPGQRSLSPPLGRRHLPLPSRFETGGPQRSPLPFPRISSPSMQQHQQQSEQQPPGMMAPQSSTVAAAAAAAAAANTNSSQSPARESTRRLSSVVWGPTGFERLESGMSRCRICHKEYSKGSSTGTLKRHFRQHQENVGRTNPYARPGSPPASAVPTSAPAALHLGSRPRAYSHLADSRAQRDASPFASPPAHTPMSSMAPTASSVAGTDPGRAPEAVADGERRADPLLGDLDSSSVIAGSALLSMAAGDSHMSIDGEAARRPMRSSDPSVYPHSIGGDPALDPETRDISVSPSPSSTSSTEDMRPVAQRPLAALDTTGSPDMDMEIEDEDDHPHKRRRATVSGVHHALAGGLGHEINSLSVAQLVALSSELVRRVAGALPLLALEADEAAAAAAGTVRGEERRSSDPLDLLFRHVSRALQGEQRMGAAPAAGINGTSPATSGLSPASFSSSALLFEHLQPAAAASLLLPPPPSCALPYTIRKQVPVPDHDRPITETVGSLSLSEMNLLSRVSVSMQRIAPLTLAEREWDNVGILLEAAKPRAEARRVFLTIDLTPQTLSEALDDPDVGVIVSYHPPIFYGWKSLTMGNLKQSLVLKCAAAGVSIYSPHTSLDSCTNGINDWLASLVGEASAVRPIKEAKPEDAGGQANAGSGRMVELAKPRPFGEVVGDVKRQLGLGRIRVARAECHSDDGGEQKLVSTVAICAGSGSSVVGPVKADVYFTGEMGHHEILAAVAKDTSCILAEHSNSERGYLRAVLAKRLQQELDEDDVDTPTSVVVSDRDRDPVTIE
ncbi:hypothetical protein LPJ61_000349 [Coemansia biformis]|uniref:BED-type domain-containing protein n=1 Tax=Coemansia biformis TaxID=1286918 RepID=A0A9W8CY86_9FUNG|nr:hypothetical protein LPJ61_000349 [Coemansia biformis]